MDLDSREPFLVVCRRKDFFIDPEEEIFLLQTISNYFRFIQLSSEKTSEQQKKFSRIVCGTSMRVSRSKVDRSPSIVALTNL